MVPVGLVTGGKGDPQDPRWRPTDHAFYGERARDVYDDLSKWCASDLGDLAGPLNCPCPIPTACMCTAPLSADGLSSPLLLCSNKLMHASPGTEAKSQLSSHRTRTAV